MKSRFSVLFALLILSSAVPMPGCWAGQKARDTGIRSIQTVDDGVREDADSGVPFLPEELREDASGRIADFFLAVSGDRAQIESVVGQWAQIRAWAEVGITGRLNAREIGLGVAKSKRVRLDEFERALYNLAGIPLLPGGT